VVFADVEIDPPRRGRPAGGLTFAQVVEAIAATFVARNSVAPRWLEDAAEAAEEEARREDEEPQDSE
jgi:hypothetical protein